MDGPARSTYYYYYYALLLLLSLSSLLSLLLSLLLVVVVGPLGAGRVRWLGRRAVAGGPSLRLALLPGYCEVGRIRLETSSSFSWVKKPITGLM